jgi:hypothetical protein
MPGCALPTIRALFREENDESLSDMNLFRIDGTRKREFGYNSQVRLVNWFKFQIGESNG